MENGIDVQPTEVAALSYSCGIPQELARRIVSQARRIEALEQTKNTLLNSVTELLNAFGEHEIQLAELRQVLVSLQAKKK